MDIQLFVKESIRQVIQGVSDAQMLQESMGAKINPMRIPAKDKPAKDDEMVYAQPTFIEFDVAVTVSEQNTTSKTGGLQGTLTVIGIKGERKSDEQTSNNTVSRIKFSIPLWLPFKD